MKTFRSMLALLLALVMVVSLIPCTFATSEETAPSEYVPTDPYVYYYDVDNEDREIPRYQYFSPYMANHYYDGEAKGRNYIFLYTMYNSTTGSQIPAYSLDIFTGAYSGNKYRCLNPDESTFTLGDGDALSTVLQGGFYLPDAEGETTSEHLARVNGKLAELATATGVSDLTIGEAIAATQLAIWKTAHGSLLTYNPLVYKYPYGGTSVKARYYNICNMERINGHYSKDSDGYLTPESQAFLTERIQKVMDYLLALEPVDMGKGILSADAFTRPYRWEFIPKGDNIFDIKVTVYLDVPVGEEDSLTLTAMLDSTHYAQIPLENGHSQYELLIRDVPRDCIVIGEGEGKDITVVIDGVQSISQVIFLEAENGADHSSSMIGMDTCQVPIHVEAVLDYAPLDDFGDLNVGHSLNLENNISINYIIPAQQLEKYSDYAIHCRTEDRSFPDPEPRVKGDYVYFTLDDLTAVDMNTKVEAWLDVQIGDQRSYLQLGEYSIATYAYSMLNKEEVPDNVKAICANLLRYGSAAQQFKGTNVDNLPDADLTAEQAAYLTDLDTVEFAAPYTIVPDMEGATVTWAGRSMSLNSTVAVNLVVDASDYEGYFFNLELRATYTDVEGVEKTVTLQPEPYGSRTDLYVFTVTQLSAADLRSELTCRVYADGEPVSQTMVYSAASYGAGKTGALLEVCQALFAYVDCARAFFG